MRRPLTLAAIVAAALLGACQVLAPPALPTTERSTPLARPAAPIVSVPIDRADAWEDVWQALERRPPPRLPAGSASDCPISLVESIGPWRGLGAGPIYPIVGADGVMRYGGGAEMGGWRVAKVVWLSAPAYRGPALIRGRQLGGPNELAFPHPERPAAATLRFPVWTGVSSPDAPEGWRQQPSYLGFKTPGCYAVQIDGINFSRVVVFRAEP